MNSIIIDISHDITSDMKPYTGDIPTGILRSAEFLRDGYTQHELKTELYTGTHIDAPMHLSADKRYIKDFAPERFIGRGALVCAVGENPVNMKAEYETLIREGDIVLVHTGHDTRWGTDGYFTAYPVISDKLAEFLAEKRIKILGLDTPSPDYRPYSVHKRLFEADICILENLSGLEKLVGIENFEVIALPLKIAAEASLVRAVCRIAG